MLGSHQVHSTGSQSNLSKPEAIGWSPVFLFLSAGCVQLPVPKCTCMMALFAAALINVSESLSV